MQETAQAMNLDARFGRSEIAIANVSPAARDEFVAHHRAWGAQVRIADLEMAAIRAKGDHEVSVAVRVAWYRVQDQDLRVTTLEQTWKDTSGEWKLHGEKRLDGDVGLIGETIVYQAPSAPRRPAQFPTIHLGDRAAVPEASD